MYLSKILKRKRSKMQPNKRTKVLTNVIQNTELAGRFFKANYLKVLTDTGLFLVMSVTSLTPLTRMECSSLFFAFKVYTPVGIIRH